MAGNAGGVRGRRISWNMLLIGEPGARCSGRRALWAFPGRRVISVYNREADIYETVPEAGRSISKWGNIIDAKSAIG